MRFPTLAALAAIAFAAMPATDIEADATTRRIAEAKPRPTPAEKRCVAANRRVERQREVVADGDARIAKERSARAACKTRRTCDRLDRALAASEARRRRYEKQLAQLESDAEKACAPAAAPSTPAASG